MAKIVLVKVKGELVLELATNLPSLNTRMGLFAICLLSYRPPTLVKK